MRISDWSSDVCSSDLLAPGHQIAHLHQRALIDAGVLVRTLELHQRVDVDSGLARLGLFRGANHDAGGVHLIDDARPLGSDRGRSEEHTSELQSLMRISYAVFCLKKQNSTHTTDSHPHTTIIP